MLLNNYAKNFMHKNNSKSSLGLKLWSINTDYYFDEAQRLYKDGAFDYVELYVVPNTLHTIEKWASIGIPLALHAPHFMHDINLSDADKYDFNAKIFLEVEEFRTALNTRYTIIHSGVGGDIKQAIVQLNKILPQGALIENKPYKAPFNTDNICRGATYEEIASVLQNTDLGFCLDIGHAICAANSLQQDPYEYLEKFQSLSPHCYHISGNFIDSEIDRHLHLHEGDFDFKKIFSIIDTTKDIAVETNKDSKTLLEDFRKDVECLAKML